MGSISPQRHSIKGFLSIFSEKVMCKHFLFNFNSINKPLTIDLTKNFF